MKSGEVVNRGVLRERAFVKGRGEGLGMVFFFFFFWGGVRARKAERKRERSMKGRERERERERGGEYFRRRGEEVKFLSTQVVWRGS